jgi:hypothetical protein
MIVNKLWYSTFSFKKRKRNRVCCRDPSYIASIRFHLVLLYDWRSSAHYCSKVCSGAELKKPPQRGGKETNIMYHKIKLYAFAQYCG